MVFSLPAVCVDMSNVKAAQSNQVEVKYENRPHKRLDTGIIPGIPLRLKVEQGANTLPPYTSSVEGDFALLSGAMVRQFLKNRIDRFGDAVMIAAADAYLESIIQECENTGIELLQKRFVVALKELRTEFIKGTKDAVCAGMNVSVAQVSGGETTTLAGYADKELDRLLAWGLTSSDCVILQNVAVKALLVTVDSVSVYVAPSACDELYRQVMKRIAFASLAALNAVRFRNYSWRKTGGTALNRLSPFSHKVFTGMEQFTNLRGVTRSDAELREAPAAINDENVCIVAHIETAVRAPFGSEISIESYGEYLPERLDVEEFPLTAVPVVNIPNSSDVHSPDDYFSSLAGLEVDYYEEEDSNEETLSYGNF